jgi:hypothetical protein
VVPQYNAPPPSGEGAGVPGYFAADEEIKTKLRHGGFKV